MTDRYTEIANSHWRQFESDAEHAARVATSTEEANRYFTRATQEQTKIYRQAMADIAPYKGAPRWDRAKAAADLAWRESTADASELFFSAFSELMEAGEISEGTSAAFDAVMVGAIMRAA